ncbi:MAG: DUF1566 domain-containing protein, partial [Rhodoferax sp.]|nr:DUF1566 domain-containing protein [Rhodoferax sp.]
PAMLTVSPAPVAPTITAQPTALTVNAGQPATFSVTATGTSLSYQWKRNGIHISGATSTSYTIATTRSADSGAQYSIKVTNSAGEVTSNPASLRVFTALPHNGITTGQCFKDGFDTLFSCGNVETRNLNPQQDGHRTTINAKSYSQVSKADGSSYDKTECVRDDLTGLMWEGKTTTGLRLSSNTFTNYHASYGNTQAEMSADSNTYGYVAAVNASSLCGYSDWRLPTDLELQTLVNYGQADPGPTIDTYWFPNTHGARYWTSTPYVGNVGNSSAAWYVNFSDGTVSFDSFGRGIESHVRLVR